VPDSVKFDSQGYIVSTQVASGRYCASILAAVKTPTGAAESRLDNCTFVGDRLLVSNFTGAITEYRQTGQRERCCPAALTGRWI